MVHPVMFLVAKAMILVLPVTIPILTMGKCLTPVRSVILHLTVTVCMTWRGISLSGVGTGTAHPTPVAVIRRVRLLDRHVSGEAAVGTFLEQRVHRHAGIVAHQAMVMT